MRHRSRRWVVEDGINLVPMLDMIFNLIFFFVVATHFGHASQQIPVNLPKSGAGAAISEQKKTAVVSFTKDNKYFLEGAQMALGDLAQQVKRQLDDGKIAAVSIQGDVSADYQTFFQLIHEFTKQNVTQFRLDYQPQAGGR